MNHADHVELIRDGVTGGGHVWADLGSGSGAFTLALADCLGSRGEIHSVDRDQRALTAQADAMRRRFPSTRLFQYRADFTAPLELPPLDGVVVANALHFVTDQDRALQLIWQMLSPGGHLVVVEYDSDLGNHWVPYPLSFESLATLVASHGFGETRLVGSRPSRFLGRMYAALAIRI